MNYLKEVSLEEVVTIEEKYEDEIIVFRVSSNEKTNFVLKIGLGFSLRENPIVQ